MKNRQPYTKNSPSTRRNSFKQILSTHSSPKKTPFPIPVDYSQIPGSQCPGEIYGSPAPVMGVLRREIFVFFCKSYSLTVTMPQTPSIDSIFVKWSMNDFRFFFWIQPFFILRIFFLNIFLFVCFEVLYLFESSFLSWASMHWRKTTL